MEHDIIDDVNIPDCVVGDPNCTIWPDLQTKENLLLERDVWNNWTGAMVPDGCADESWLNINYNTIEKRWVEDVAPAEECWKHERKEPRFDTNLLEEKFYFMGTTMGAGQAALDDLGVKIERLEEDIEQWEWKNIETLPWDYTEFVLPEVPEAEGLEAMGYIGDYILVSSFMTENWFVDYNPLDPLGGYWVHPVRVKFDYDAAFSSSAVDEYIEGDPPYPESKSGIYVNTLGVVPSEVPEEACDYDDPAFGGNGNGAIDKSEALDAVFDFFGGIVDKAVAVQAVIYYISGGTPCA
jgi:hypothetical protein